MSSSSCYPVVWGLGWNKDLSKAFLFVRAFGLLEEAREPPEKIFLFLEAASRLGWGTEVSLAVLIEEHLLNHKSSCKCPLVVPACWGDAAGLQTCPHSLLQWEKVAVWPEAQQNLLGVGQQCFGVTVCWNLRWLPLPVKLGCPARESSVDQRKPLPVKATWCFRPEVLYLHFVVACNALQKSLMENYVLKTNAACASLSHWRAQQGAEGLFEWSVSADLPQQQNDLYSLSSDARWLAQRLHSIIDLTFPSHGQTLSTCKEFSVEAVIWPLPLSSIHDKWSRWTPSTNICFLKPKSPDFDRYILLIRQFPGI